MPEILTMIQTSRLTPTPAVLCMVMMTFNRQTSIRRTCLLLAILTQTWHHELCTNAEKFWRFIQNFEYININISVFAHEQSYSFDNYFDIFKELSFIDDH